jgi:RNA polymerase sigma-70 factor (ECF subfamily)
MREETLVKNLLQYQPMLEGMLTAMVGDPHVAQDLFQETALIMTRKRGEATEDCAFLAWGRQIAVNVVRDFRKSTARRKLRIMDDAVLERVALAFELTDQSLWEERRLALGECLEKLPDRHRQVLQRRYLQSEPIEMLARSLSTSRNALEVLLHRLRRTLQECVETKLRGRGVAGV